MNWKWVKKAILAGVIGAIVMSIFGLWIAPIFGVPPMNPANGLARAMGDNMVLGWIGHLVVGAILAIIYASIQKYLPGPSAIRGAIFSLAPWIVAMVAVAPILGMPLFMGSTARFIGSLLGHIVYGLVMGAIYGKAKQRQRSI